jgi:uroporphyrinogen-III synthase
MGSESAAAQRWVDVCDYHVLAPDRGVCALVEGRQVAIFRVSPTDELFAINNFDPFSQAFVLSRGIVGTRGDAPKVASPIYKQSFDLRTGQCLDDVSVRVPTYPVAIRGGRVAIGVNWDPPSMTPAKNGRERTKGTLHDSRSAVLDRPRVAPSQGPHSRTSARNKPLSGCRIAVAEVREAEVLDRLLAEQGATIMSYPLVRIADTPDKESVVAFLRELAEGGLDALVLLTGEGVRRLMAFAEREGLSDAVVRRLGAMAIITRGPKPARALRELSLLPTLSAEQPTTEGVIEALQSRDWRGARVGVQLCGQKPNARLLDYFTSSGAVVKAVAPYVYVHASDDERVLELIGHLSVGELDAVAFTCRAQVERLFAVAESHGVEDTLRGGFRRTRVAALGPVVAAALRERNCRVDIIPARSFFMRSLTREIVGALKSPPRRAASER